MKKLLAIAAVVVLVAFAAPALAATNPFMDVPVNHWSYDAIGQLAAHGILSGYPDGTYKGRQPTTRYEMASAIARALGYIDINKASRQDVEMLKKLVVEFKDELDALGVRVDELSDDVGLLKSRLGGWKIGGVMRVDLTEIDNELDNRDGTATLARSRLYFERWFGEDESMHFMARADQNATWQLLYAQIPVFWDSTLTVGRFAWDKEANYYFNSGTYGLTTVWMGLDAFLTDRYTDGFGWEKSFGLGKATAYLVRNNDTSRNATHGLYDNGVGGLDVWEAFGMGEFQFTENFAFDLGFQYFFGDDMSLLSDTEKLNSLWTVFAGGRFNFNDDIELKGIFYYQDGESETIATGTTTDGDGVAAVRLIAVADQNLLKYTNLFLQYDYVEAGFVRPLGQGASMMIQSTALDDGTIFGDNYDADVFRLAARQVWNPKWATFLYFAYHTWDQASDPSANQWALGVQYSYNPSVKFGLSYINTSYNDEAVALGAPYDDESLFRFRTEVWF